MATVFREAIAVQRRTVPSPYVALTAQDQLQSDRLLNLLKSKDQFFDAAGQPPTYDYPNPWGKPYPVSLRTFTNPVQIQLIGKDKFFGSAGQPPTYDYPNPSGKPFPRDLLGYTSGTDIQLIGKDQFFGGAGERTNFDFQNPRGRSFHPSQLPTGGNLLESTLSQIVSPFAQYDYPNPRGRQFPIDLRGYLNPAEVQLIGKDQFFGAAGERTQIEFPNPRKRALHPSLFTWTGSNLLETTLTVTTSQAKVFLLMSQ